MVKKYKVRVDGREYEVEVEGVEEGERTVGVEGKAKGRRSDVEKRGEKLSNQQETMTAKGEVVCAPMPSKVIRICCKPGERMKSGDLLMVIEAMKMENEVVSPVDGVVKDVCVLEGASVSSGEKLVVFE